MNIGIDLRVLQSGHKFRGVGEVAKQTIDRILQLAVSDPARPSFVFYEYASGDDPKELLHVPKDLKYQVVTLGPPPEKDQSSVLQKLGRDTVAMFGEPIKNSQKSDVFLQFDYAFGVPKNTRTVLVKHDIIPYVFWNDYFTSPKTHIKNKALRTTIRTVYDNYKFLRILRRSLQDAGIILTVSDYTKKDLARHFDVPHDKMKVAFLGASITPAKTVTADRKQLPTKPYLLFIGGIDKGKRRAVDDIVAAFNNLKAKGQDIQLVLVGENFKSPTDIPIKDVRNAVLESSYKDDILTMGYIDDATKQKLFKDAIAFVFPTRYEGFGIMTLEAMLLECPVITYKNSSTPEVGGDHALYANNWQDIQQQVQKLLDMSSGERAKFIAGAKAHAEQFTWEKTAQVIYDELTRTN